MKCPLFIGSRKFLGEDIMHLDTDCLKKECAWWHPGLEDCRLATLDDAIATLMGIALNLSLDLEKSGKLPRWQPPK